MSTQIINAYGNRIAQLEAENERLRAAADELAAAAEAEVAMYVYYVDDETGPWAAIKVGVSGTEINVGEEPARLREALTAYRSLSDEA